MIAGRIEFGLVVGALLVAWMRKVAREAMQPLFFDRRSKVALNPEGNKADTSETSEHRIDSGTWSKRNESEAMGLNAVSRNGQNTRAERQKPEGVATMANFNEQRQNERKDQAWPGQIDYRLGFGREHASDTMWRCNVLCAGKLYSSSLFPSRQEAEEFARKLGDAEPDKMFDVEAIKAHTVWN